jgi:transposase-like protein
MGEVLNCPACRSYDVRVLSRCDDGLNSYVCHDCTKVFHVREKRLKEHATAKEPSEVLTQPSSRRRMR